MSYLNDPRVLFAAERTLMAWSRTAAGLMAFGFLIDRSEVLLGGNRALGAWIGFGFIALGVVLSALAIVQYRRALVVLSPAEIPPRYWVNLAVYASAIVGLLGVALAAYLAFVTFR